MGRGEPEEERSGSSGETDSSHRCGEEAGAPSGNLVSDFTRPIYTKQTGKYREPSHGLTDAFLRDGPSVNNNTCFAGYIYTDLRTRGQEMKRSTNINRT